MSELLDVIVRDSNKQFRLRLVPSLRRLGIFQIIGTKDYLDIDFIGGDRVTILYPNEFKSLPDVIESELLLQTKLSVRDVDNIKYFVKDYIEEIKEEIKELK